MFKKSKKFGSFQNTKLSLTAAGKVLGGRRPLEPGDIDCSNPQNAGQVRYCDALANGNA